MVHNIYNICCSWFKSEQSMIGLLNTIMLQWLQMLQRAFSIEDYSSFSAETSATRLYCTFFRWKTHSSGTEKSRYRLRDKAFLRLYDFRRYYFVCVFLFFMKLFEKSANNIQKGTFYSSHALDCATYLIVPKGELIWQEQKEIQKKLIRKRLK